MTALKEIAKIHSDFSSKFGVPRQSNLVNTLRSTIVFEPEFRNPDALRGLDQFSHIWILWGFSETERDGWTPTVRPPRLGGNTRMGVFATRSPFRPNPIALSSVRVDQIEWKTEQGPVIHILGADMMDQTPVYDIKPYLPIVDCHPDATGGFASVAPLPVLQVVDPKGALDVFSPEKRSALIELLSYDPRPAYQNDPERIYGMGFAGYEVHFSVKGKQLFLQEVFASETPHRNEGQE